MGGDGQTVAAASSSPIGAQHLSEPRRLRRSARPRSPVWLLSQARRGVVALRHGEGEQPTVLKAVRGGCKSRRRLQIEGQCAAALSPSYPLSLERKLRTYWQWPVRGVVLSQRRGEEGEGDGESTEKRHREQIRPSAARKATPPSTSVPSPRFRHSILMQLRCIRWCRTNNIKAIFSTKPSMHRLVNYQVVFVYQFICC
ncbi:uncharacterized protein LOC125527711 [Triticum urartu]|uniref:uncharacterized protein LOC125527711 n=1 Tax=Triticum urartu TaxID=4572 RepID=UPI00204417CD|nr:uncharacterized protein LOC125527711 [Triticum urartu]